MAAFLGFAVLCFVVWLFVYIIPQETQGRWFKNLFAAALIAGALGIAAEVWMRGGRMPW